MEIAKNPAKVFSGETLITELDLSLSVNANYLSCKNIKQLEIKPHFLKRNFFRNIKNYNIRWMV